MTAGWGDPGNVPFPLDAAGQSRSAAPAMPWSTAHLRKTLVIWSVGWWLGHWCSVAALSLPVPAYSQGLSLTHSLDPNCYLHCGMEFAELG